MEESKFLLNIGKTHEAFKRLKTILPKFKDTQDEWKVHELLGAVFHDLGDADGAVQAYLYTAHKDRYLRSQREHYSNYLFALHYLNSITDKELANEHFIYNNLFENDYLTSDIRSRSQNSKLTIGYIAPNFLESSSARFYESLLTEYNRNDFMVKCFSLSHEGDQFTNFIDSNVDNMIILEDFSIEEAAQKIVDEDVDILFDLGGHSEGGMTLQIMSYKPALIQISGIGWFDTTGLKAIDYFLTDNYLAPIGHEKYFTERLLRLSGAFAFKPTESMESVSSLYTQAHSFITFASFNNFMKITDDYLKCVKKILNLVENSKFVIQDTTMIPARKIEMEKRLKKLRLPLDKIELRLGNDDYLKDYALIDIILDTFPYNGGTMTATALYMGVPVISLYGTRHSSRFGADILRLAGMSELIANDMKEYINKSVSLAEDQIKLSSLKRTLRERLCNSKLLDTKGFIAELEYQYKRMVGA
ncbi:MAG: glycosyl transferase family 41 [Selenomonadaceae bacterium]|nr:glycosyl transferase family 41 [Selenomonadaceae bacterium]